MEASKTTEVKENHIFTGILRFGSVFIPDTENVQELVKLGIGAARFSEVSLTRQRHFKKGTPTTPTADSSNTKGQAVFPDPPVEVVDTTSSELNTVNIKILQEGKELSVETTSASGSNGVNNSNNHDKTSCPGDILLLDEEAFFLLTNGRLIVVKEVKRSFFFDWANGFANVSKGHLWDIFTLKNPKFAIKYKVYSHFRSQGFVVKTGTNFGADFCVYRTLPSHCHSEYCVAIVDGVSSDNNNNHIKGFSVESDRMEWRHISSLTRVVPDVMKILIICYVLPKKWSSSKTAEHTSSLSTDSNKSFLGSIFSVGKAVLNFFSGEAKKEGLHNVDMKADKLENLPKEESNLDLLFNFETEESIDFSTESSLNNLVVRPVTAMIRRQHARGDNYQGIKQVQKKCKSTSILKRPRQIKSSSVGGKKSKKRRNANEVRSKVTSKNEWLWKNLKISSEIEGASISKKVNKKIKGKMNASDCYPNKKKKICREVKSTEEIKSELDNSTIGLLPLLEQSEKHESK